MDRPRYLKEIENQFSVHSVCAILGPRQVGKTTLAKMYIEKHFKDDYISFDLENPLDLERLENPMLALSQIKKTLIVIDEIQFRPELFPILRVVVDDLSNNFKFLILGSASRDLIKQSSESLAGRIGYIELPPFCLFEVKESSRLQVRGGFPRSYLADSEEESLLWRKNYISTFLERDIPNLGFNIPAAQLRRFWIMIAHYHGQILNYSEIARSLMISDNTVRRYVDILSGTFMIRVLVPWFENISKRQVKSPKIYLRDTGILNSLLGITNKEQLEVNPKLGSIWEGFALEQIICFFGLDFVEAFFWSTQADAELDLFILKFGKRLGFEFKYSDVPKVTRSMHSALNDLKLDHLYIVYPGEITFKKDDKITIASLNDIVNNKIKF